MHHLGIYVSYEDAVEARLKAEHIVHDGFIKSYYEWKEMADKDPEWAETHHFVYQVKKTKNGLEVSR